MRSFLPVCFCVILCFLAIYWSSTIVNLEARKINTSSCEDAIPKAQFLIKNLQEQPLMIPVLQTSNLQITLYTNTLGTLLLGIVAIGMMVLIFYHQQILNLQKNLILFREQTSNRSESILDFNYALGHDLKTPVQNIRLLLEKFMAKNHERLDEESQLSLQRVNSLTQIANELIDGSLRLAEQDHIPMNKGVFQTWRVVTNLCQSMQELNPEKNIVFQLNNLPDQIGDPLMLRQVFANLIQNAVKFSLNSSPIRIEIYSIERGRYRDYFVKDNGCGLPENAANTIFNPFKTAHDRSIYPGNGLGLAIVKTIIKRHGGTVWAEKNLEGGAIFGFRLPV